MARYAAVAASQVDLKPHAPDVLFPASVAVYVSILVGLAALWAAWRNGQEKHLAPLKKDLSDFKDEMKAIEGRAMQEVRQAVAHFDDKLEEQRSQNEYQYSDRLRRIEASQVGQDAFNDRVIAFMSESQTDRRAMGSALVELRLTVLDGQKEQRAALVESERRIMDAIARSGGSAGGGGGARGHA